jgi:hypothetical protein
MDFDEIKMNLVIFRLVLKFFSDPTKPQWLGISYAIFLSITVFCQIIFQRAYFQCQFFVGLRFRAAITGLVYRKVDYSSSYIYVYLILCYRV